MPPVPPTASAIFSLAHKLYAARWGLIVGVSVTAFLVIGLLGLITGLIDSALVGPDSMFDPISALSQILVGTPLLLGPLYVTARLFRGEPADYKDLLVGFRRWGHVVVVTLLIHIIVYAGVIAFALAMLAAGFAPGGRLGAIAAIGLIGIFMLCFVIWIAIRLYFAALLCADPAGPNLGIIESIRTSWDITRGHAWALFILAVAGTLIAMMSLLLLVVPFVLYGGPLLMCISGVAYALICHKAGLIPLAPYDQCPFCNYDLRAIESDICPECGRAVCHNTAIN
jgi:uncharacterized membrane protein